MNIPLGVNQTELLDVLLNVAITRSVFIWGAPGIGKSSIVENFAGIKTNPKLLKSKGFILMNQIIIILSEKVY